MRDLGRRLLEFAVSVLAAGLLLCWAWSLLRPLLPMFIGLAALAIAVPFAVRRFRGW